MSNVKYLFDAAKYVVNEKNRKTFPDVNDDNVKGTTILPKNNINGWIDLNKQMLGEEFNKIYVDYKRVFDGKIDDFVNDELLNTSEYFDNFVVLVYNAFNEGLKHFIKLKKDKDVNFPLNDGDIQIIYKGGNLIRLTYKDFKEDIKNDPIGKKNNKVLGSLKSIDEYFGYLYSKSDNDYTIYVKKGDMSDEDYVLLTDEVTEFSYLILALIRNEMFSDMKKNFNYYNKNPEEKAKAMKNIIDSLNKTVNENAMTKQNGRFVSCQLDNIVGYTYDYKALDKKMADVGILGERLLIGNYRSDFVVRSENQDYSKIQHIPPLSLKTQEKGLENIQRETKMAEENYLEILNERNKDAIENVINYLKNGGTESIKKYINKEDLEIIKKYSKDNSKNRDYVKGLLNLTTELMNKGYVESPYYCYVNKTLEFDGYSHIFGRKVTNAFNLSRMKVNVTGTYVDPNKLNNEIIHCDIRNLSSCQYNFGGELIDVSIPLLQDSSRPHFDEHYHDLIKNYIIADQNVIGYSLSYLLYDLSNMIFFKGISHPLLINKFTKRLDRYYLLLFIYLFNTIRKYNYDKELVDTMNKKTRLIVEFFVNFKKDNNTEFPAEQYKKLSERNLTEDFDVNIGYVISNFADLHENSVKEQFDQITDKYVECLNLMINYFTALDEYLENNPQNEEIMDDLNEIKNTDSEEKERLKQKDEDFDEKVKKVENDIFYKKNEKNYFGGNSIINNMKNKLDNVNINESEESTDIMDKISKILDDMDD